MATIVADPDGPLIRPLVPEARDYAGEIGARIWRLRIGVLYVSTFILAYVLIVSPTFAHTGLVDRLAVDGSFVLASALAVAPSPWLAASATRPSDVCLWILYLSAYVPSMIVPAFVLGSGWGLLLVWVTLAASFALVMLVVGRIHFRIPGPALSPRIYEGLLIAMAIAGVAGMIWFFGVPTGIPSLEQVADTRDSYRDQLVEGGRLAGYVLWWTGGVVAPLLVAFGAWKRSPFLVLSGFAVLGLVYATTALRSMLFTALLLVVLVLLIARVRRRFGVAFGGAAIVLVVTCAIVAVAGWVVPASMLVRRALIVPGQVFAYYHDFFASNPVYLLSHSIFEGFVARPYPESPPALIGLRYFNDAHVSANGNLWADGIANFGVAGIVIASLALAVVLVLLDAVAYRKPPVIAITVGAVGIWGLTNSGVLTTLLTHGLGLLLVMIWLLPRERPAASLGRAFRAAHVSTVHRSDDPRIARKSVPTLAAAGYDMTLIARGSPPVDQGEFRFESLGDVSGRVARVVVMPWRVLRIAWRIRADVYHLHDPELLPVGMVLKLAGAHVIYDVHEDLPRQIAYKPYIPSPVRPLVAAGADALEWVAARVVDGVVAATPRIGARFPSNKTVVVQNFPLRSEFAKVDASDYTLRGELVAYVGRVTVETGALVMAAAAGVVGARRSTEFVIAGPIADPLLTSVAETAGSADVRLPGWLDRAGVVGLLQSARVGLVLFQPVANYVEAYPTKLFEYMASGVPVVASDFPLWREIVGTADGGLLVDPTDPRAVADAIENLLDDPKRAAEMGRNGRAAVFDRYLWDQQGARLVSFYARILGPIPVEATPLVPVAGVASN